MGVQYRGTGEEVIGVISADFGERFRAFTIHTAMCSEVYPIRYTVDSGSLAVFRSSLKTFLFRRTFNPV